jgi:hypothetical protein
MTVFDRLKELCRSEWPGSWQITGEVILEVFPQYGMSE